MARITRIRIDADLCTGHYACIDACPDVFYIDERLGQAAIRIDALNQYTRLEPHIREAADTCPSGAIILEEADEAVLADAASVKPIDFVPSRSSRRPGTAA